MTHSMALSERTTPIRPEENGTCTGQLLDGIRVMVGDVDFLKTRCEECSSSVYLVGGRLHWWNYAKPAEATP